jgi:hypothetical protein
MPRGHLIRIDQSKPLAEEPNKGPNRWHEVVEPVVEVVAVPRRRKLGNGLFRCCLTLSPLRLQSVGKLDQAPDDHVEARTQSVE